MILHPNVVEFAIVDVSAAHQISCPPTFSYWPDRQHIPSHKQNGFPGMYTSSYPGMDANGQHTHHTVTLPMIDTSRFQFPNEDQFSEGKSFKKHSAFAFAGPISGNNFGAPTTVGPYSTNNVGSSPTVWQNSGSDNDLSPLSQAFDWPGADDQNNDAVGYYYER